MSFSKTEILLGVTVLGAVISAVAVNWLAAHANGTEGQQPLTDGAAVSKNPGFSYTNIGNVDASSMGPYLKVYQGAGRQETRSSFNGQIYAKRFHRGGNPNSVNNFEQSYAFQTSTKNPFANGNNNTYARAVNAATQDPTNQATALVLGPGVAPNNRSLPVTCQSAYGDD